MADDTEITDGIKPNLNEAAAEPRAPLDNVELKGPTENNDAAASTPSSADSQAEGSSRASPDPSCSICLGKLRNKSFTDSCYHTFCFACLVEWSKVKAVCPLCKVKFKSIVHNVRSNDDYDQYYIGRTNTAAREPSPELFRWTENHSFHYASSLREREIRISFLQYQQHRCTYAPHSVRLHPTRSAAHQERNREEPRNIQFRRRVYNENLWAKPNTSKLRTCSPTYYAANHACTRRLVPWLTRELIVLLDNEERVRFVLDFMMSLILRYSILSEEFFLHIEPYLGDRASHFVHEFYNYATCIYDIERYDELMEYDVQGETSMSSPGSDVIAVDSDSSIEDHARIASASSTVLSPRMSYSSNNLRFGKHKRTQQKPLTVYLKKSHESNSWNVWRPSPALSPVFSMPEDLSLPSSSRACNDLFASTSGISAFPRVTPPLVTLSSSDEGECVIVEELKPRSLRTPEVIEVSSSPEIDVERPYTPALPDLEPVSDGSLGVVDRYESDGSPFVLDNSSPVVINVPDSSQITLHDDSSCNSEESTVDYSMSRQGERRRSRKPKFPERTYYPTPWSPNERSRWSSSSSSRSRSREESFRSWSQERESSIQQFFDNKRRSLNADSGHHFSANSEYGENSQRLDATTSSDWDIRYSSSSSSNVKKRVKLRSVVKRSSQHSDSSNHSPPEKKLKSKKKKRKKGEKHKHRKH